MREGATENTASCKALLADLIERGLDPNRAILVVIDGAKALHKAVIETFGARLIHRCHAHKKRNVTDAAGADARIGAQCDEPGLRDARSQARPPPVRISHVAWSPHIPARRAPAREGLEETLTVMRLDLPESLERVLASTNLTENLFSRVREDRAPSKALARWHDDSEMERGWSAGSRAPLPQACRLSRSAQAGRRVARS